MTPKERVRIALEGGKPDRVPVFPIYDMGYVMRSLGRDERDWHVSSNAERVAVVEQSFLRHDVDGFFVHIGVTDEFVQTHSIEKHDSYWLVTHNTTGEQYRLLPDGCHATVDGTPIPRALSSGGVSKIQTEDDIERQVPPPIPVGGFRMRARYAPLRNLVARYPDHHFSFQLGSPMGWAVDACGGYVEGLTLLAENRGLFRKLLERCVQNELSRIVGGRSAGGMSVWFTSYHTGADTISPRDYADLVFPYEREVCRAAREAGLSVLNWYVGDLMPNLDKVMELPLDALVPEQGRKGYTTDLVEIRRRVGPRFCLFGFGFENDYCKDDRESLARELRRQFDGAGRNGAFIAGTPIMPPNADPDAVEFYFSEARKLGL